MTQHWCTPYTAKVVTFAAFGLGVLDGIQQGHCSRLEQAAGECSQCSTSLFGGNGPCGYSHSISQLAGLTILSAHGISRVCSAGHSTLRGSVADGLYSEKRQGDLGRAVTESKSAGKNVARLYPVHHPGASETTTASQSWRLSKGSPSTADRVAGSKGFSGFLAAARLDLRAA